MTTSPRPILFVSSPESGLLNPMLVIARELARRGVPDLWFATDDNRQTDIEALGAQFVSLGPVIPQLSSVTWPDDVYRKVTQRSRWKAFKTVALYTFDPTLRMSKHLTLDEAVKRIKPALMVIDNISGFAVRSAVTHGVPYVLSAPFMPSNVLFNLLPTGYPRPNSGYSINMTRRQRIANRLWRLRVLGLIFNPKMFRMVRKFYKMRTELGAAKSVDKFSSKSAKAELILCHSVPGLDYPFPLPEKLRLVGAMVPPLPEAETGELTEWLDAHDSIIYMGFGTITRLTRDQVRSMVEVARRLEGTCHVLWKLPRNQQEYLPEDLPGNLRIENWVPSQMDVLAHDHVKVFVNHGGGNGLHEGLYFGKPLLTRPLWVDCYDQAVRAEDAGVGLTLDAQVVDVDDMVDKINRLLREDSFRERAEHFRDLNLAAGGRETAADLILGLLTDPAPSDQDTALASALSSAQL